MTPREILEGGRAIIADPERFIQGHYAADAAGNRVWELGERAVRFCSIGATRRVNDGEIGLANWEAEMLLNHAANSLYGTTITDVNDRLGREAALAAFNLAIAEAS
jgi:hypothetical protein